MDFKKEGTGRMECGRTLEQTLYFARREGDGSNTFR